MAKKELPPEAQKRFIGILKDIRSIIATVAFVAISLLPAQMACTPKSEPSLKGKHASEMTTEELNLWLAQIDAESAQINKELDDIMEQVQGQMNKEISKKLIKSWGQIKIPFGMKISLYNIAVTLNKSRGAVDQGRYDDARAHLLDAREKLAESIKELKAQNTPVPKQATDLENWIINIKQEINDAEVSTDFEFQKIQYSVYLDRIKSGENTEKLKKGLENMAAKLRELAQKTQNKQERKDIKLMMSAVEWDIFTLKHPEKAAELYVKK